MARQHSLAGRAALVGVAMFVLTLAPAAAAQEPAAPQWCYGLNLKCHTSEQELDKAHTFGLEVYRGANRKALYITETGMVAVGAFDLGKFLPPTWLHKLDLKVRPAGFTEFPPKALGLEVFRDDNNGHWMYLCETGALAVVPGAGSAKPAPKAKAADWLHGLELKVRKAGEATFNKDTKTWGLEVYRDAHNGHLVYLCESGALAVVPGAKNVPVPTPKATAPLWLNGFNLRVRKAGAMPAQAVTFGVEVFRDENNGNVLYISETGSLAVVPGKVALPAPLPNPKPLTLTHQFDLKCRKAAEKEFGPLAFGVAAYVDANTDCTLYISEKGALAAVANP
jgi:hypothetical protein